MSKLLERAKVKRENAENSYKKIQLNDAYLDDCCYNLQQAVEMTLKYLVELSGQAYVENHDLRAQLNLLNRRNVSIPSEQELRNMAETINNWETSSRYKDSFTALIQDVDDVRFFVDALIKEADSKTTVNPLRPLSVFPSTKHTQ